jgi:hypothetical protein
VETCLVGLQALCDECSLNWIGSRAALPEGKEQPLRLCLVSDLLGIQEVEKPEYIHILSQRPLGALYVYMCEGGVCMCTCVSPTSLPHRVPCGNTFATKSQLTSVDFLCGESFSATWEDAWQAGPHRSWWGGAGQWWQGPGQRDKSSWIILTVGCTPWQGRWQGVLQLK